jgi:4'-phosphopantetheinyl transferase
VTAAEMQTAAPPAWSSEPPFGLPALGEVHVWRIDLEAAYDTDSLRSLLSGDEIERADRYRSERSRRDFTVARASLRLLLARYLGDKARSFRFELVINGKPRLAGLPRGLEFNLSHSGRLALIAFSRSGRLGVDIECRGALKDMDNVARTSFSPNEYAAYRALPDGERSVGFYNAWTRKEAFIKALGLGLAFPLHDFDVSLAPCLPPRLLRIEGETGPPERWSLACPDAASDYAAAVALDLPEFTLKCFDAATFSSQTPF